LLPYLERLQDNVSDYEPLLLLTLDMPPGCLVMGHEASNKKNLVSLTEDSMEAEPFSIDPSSPERTQANLNAAFDRLRRRICCYETAG
jgi:hypothetical protein